MPDKISKPEPRLSKKGQEAKAARAERQAALCVRTCSNAKYSSVAGRPTGPTGRHAGRLLKGSIRDLSPKDTRA